MEFMIPQKPTPAKKKPVIIMLRHGSLQKNMTRVLRQQGWKKVVWNVPQDFELSVSSEVIAPDLEDALIRVLSHFPVQLDLYPRKKLAEFVPRTMPKKKKRFR